MTEWWKPVSYTHLISYAEQGNVPKEIAHYRNGFLPEAGCYTVFLIKTDGNPKEMECMELQEVQRNLEMFSVSYIQEMRRVCREIEVFCTGNSLYVLTNTDNENVLKTLVNSLKNSLKANASAIWPFAPVSYTHLDVYKRQLQTTR